MGFHVRDSSDIYIPWRYWFKFSPAHWLDNMQFSPAILCALLLAATISSYASPLDIWNPQIIEPHAGATWVIGQFYNVTW